MIFPAPRPKKKKRLPRRGTGFARNTSRKKVWRRKPSEFARIYGSRARVRFVKSLPCVYCVALHPVFNLLGGKSHNAHTVTGGTGRKADYTTIVPLCAGHHRRYDLHQFPFDTHQARQTMKDLAAQTERAWHEHQRRAS